MRRKKRDGGQVLRKLGKQDLMELLLEERRHGEALEQQLSDAPKQPYSESPKPKQSKPQGSKKKQKRRKAAAKQTQAAPKQTQTKPRADIPQSKVPFTTGELETEISRRKHRTRFQRMLRSTVGTLIVVAAIAVLVATLWLPVLQTYGTSMEPTLDDGNIVVSIKAKHMETGDVIAFYYNNKILIKRLIAQPGDWVDIDPDGTVHVNGEILDEPYLTEKSFGECDIDLPYQVPEGRVFVMGDHRSVSIDSRSKAIGCISTEEIVGKLVFRVWPLNVFGRL